MRQFHQLSTHCAPFYPLLPSFIPKFQWNQEVREKKDDHIYAAEINGVVHFGENIPKPHKLCPIMEKEFQDWLRLMLLWDKSRRGGKTPTTKVGWFGWKGAWIETEFCFLLSVESSHHGEFGSYGHGIYSLWPNEDSKQKKVDNFHITSTIFS